MDKSRKSAASGNFLLQSFSFGILDGYEKYLSGGAPCVESWAISEKPARSLTTSLGATVLSMLEALGRRGP